MSAWEWVAVAVVVAVGLVHVVGLVSMLILWNMDEGEA